VSPVFAQVLNMVDDFRLGCFCLHSHLPGQAGDAPGIEQYLVPVLKQEDSILVPQSGIYGCRDKGNDVDFVKAW
jgi:hypothetical protein